MPPTKTDAKSPAPAPTVIPPTTDEHALFIAVMLRVGGIALNDAEIERAKTHSLTVERRATLNGPHETLIGAIPSV